VGNRPLLAGQRVVYRSPLAAHRQVELRAGPADRIELDRADAFEPIALGARQIADALLVVVDGDDVDDVLDAVIPGAQACLAPAAEVAADLRLGLPALRRNELGVAGILAVLGQLGLGEEIVEADLADAAA